MAKPMSRKRLRTLSSELDNHMKWILMASCKPGIGSPFGDEGVSITAVIEHFGEEQKKALIAWLNDNTHGAPWFMKNLKATPLDRAEGGIQFKALDGVHGYEFISDLNSATMRGECLELESYLFYENAEPTFTNFYSACQIRFSINKPFGKTTARKVLFNAYHGVPLCFMIDIQRILESSELCQKLGLGEVAITKYKGLPAPYSDHSMQPAYKKFPRFPL